MHASNLITPDVSEAYATDGAVCVRQAFNPEWIKTLTEGLERNLTQPSERSRLWDRDAEGRSCFYDSQVWREIDEYRDFVENSIMAELAGRLMGSRRVNFYFDAMFVRTPGTQFRTPFHQDEPYWSVEGFDCCSAWMPLVSVEKSSALEFVSGSHRWNKNYSQTNFGALTGDRRDQVVFDTSKTEPFPDIEGARGRYTILSWDMEPGDVAFFNGRTIHGGSGQLQHGRDLKVFNTKWLGDDVRIKFREEGMDPDHSQVMTAAGLKTGDRIGTDLYPLLWEQSA